MDTNLKPVSNISLSLEGKEYIETNSNGKAFLNTDAKNLPPNKIWIDHESYEAESWNYSKGILEIILREKNYEELTFRLVNVDQSPLKNNPVILEGPQTIKRRTNSDGYVTIPYPKNEELQQQYKLIIPGFEIKINKIKANPPVVVVNSLDENLLSNTLEIEEKVSIINTRLSFLDTVTSIEGLYLALHYFDLTGFTNEERSLIDNKFYELYILPDSSVINNTPITVNLDGVEAIEKDLAILRDQAENNQQSIIENRQAFEDRLNRVNQQLTEQKENLSEEQKKQITADVNAIEIAILANKDIIGDYQAEYLQLITELRRKLENLQGIESELKKTQAEREREQKLFRQKIIRITLIIVALIVFIFILVMLVRIFFKQKKELKEANNKIAKINTHLEKLVDQKTESLVKINNELDQFLYRSAHNLRRPLSSILGLHNIAKLTLQGDSLVLFEKAADTAYEMDELLQKLQMISHINLPAEPKIINFNSEIESVLESNKAIIQNENISISKEIQQGLEFTISPILVSIIISNLIENAIRFCVYSKKPDKKIEITVSELNKQVKLSIKDNGIGISEEVRDKIWDMFFVGFEFGTGNGLGLYITKKAIEVLGGSISLETEEYKFTEFTVLLPNADRNSKFGNNQVEVESQNNN
ncbi:sensor histidine kinase [Marinigracilibium pacificum]|uniref:histidine kinase n=1 Tax=Marinigracilibium pacificum TaxID=2729599 RepID=A0A848J2P5_9BACT|nr:ATP-binding protein [Marinigracilibium pacificum]NMM49608.1 GHKL domain-containing protein [Marinigracilibium pacificum]